MLCRFDLAMVKDLDVVFNHVCQLDGQPFRRIENYLNIVRAILVMRSNSQRHLLLDRPPKFVPGCSNEGRIEQV